MYCRCRCICQKDAIARARVERRNSSHRSSTTRPPRSSARVDRLRASSWRSIRSARNQTLASPFSRTSPGIMTKKECSGRPPIGPRETTEGGWPCPLPPACMGARPRRDGLFTKNRSIVVALDATEGAGHCSVARRVALWTDGVVSKYCSSVSAESPAEGLKFRGTDRSYRARSSAAS